MALFGFAFLALLVLGLATCIVGLAIWIMRFALPIGMMAASLATTNDSMKGGGRGAAALFGLYIEPTPKVVR